MTWSDIPFRPSAKVLRQFAAAWLIFFLFYGVYECFVRKHPVFGLGLSAAALVFGLLGLIKPAGVRWLFVGWMVLAFPIGWLLSTLMLLLMFFGVLTPVAMVFRLRGRDLLQRKHPSAEASFWLPKAAPQDVRSYFRQY